MFGGSSCEIPSMLSHCDWFQSKYDGCEYCRTAAGLFPVGVVKYSCDRERGVNDGTGGGGGSVSVNVSGCTGVEVTSWGDWSSVKFPRSSNGCDWIWCVCRDIVGFFREIERCTIQIDWFLVDQNYIMNSIMNSIIILLKLLIT